MQPIRVLQLGSPSGLYGAERWILALVKYIDKNRIESIVSIIKDEPRTDPPICREAKAAGYHTHAFEAYGKVNFSAIKQIRAYIQRNNIHILHTHGYKVDIIGRLATAGTPCKMISTPHGWSKNAGIKLSIYEFIDRLFLPFFDAVAPLSEDLYHNLKWVQRFKCKLLLIRNGVDIIELDMVKNIANEISEWKSKGDFIFGYIGQLIPRKRLVVFLKAFSKLELPGKKLAIVGAGEMQEELQQLTFELNINESVRFFGYRENRISFLKGFDAFVLPSSLEGIPRCVMEAMASRIPVIASDIPGCRDLIIDGKTGLLCKVDDVDSLIDSLNIVLDQDLSDNLVTNAREFIVENYSAEYMANEYLKLYETLTNRHHE